MSFINRLVFNFPMDIFAIRRANLLKLINADEYRGNQAKFSKDMGIKSPQINRWLSTTASDTRNITEKSARKLEARCGKPPGWLDLYDATPLAKEPDAPPYLSVIQPKTKRESRLDAINKLLRATDDEGLSIALYEVNKIAEMHPFAKQTPASSR